MRNETINTKVDAEEVKKAIVDNMEKALNEYDWRYTRKALEKIYDKFMERKGSLIDILSKHPKWNAEKLYIHFDANYTRTFDKEELESFVNYFRHNIFEIENVSPTEKLRESFPIFYQKVENLYWTSLGKMSYFFDILTEYIEGSRVTKKIEETINDQYPELKCKEGQKLSRLINKYCVMVGFDKEPDYNRRFAKLADSLNPITYTRHTVLSVNPVDYLMMSNGSTWANCHTIDVEDTEGRSENYGGCYCAGTLSYMLDSCSMVFYTVDESTDGDNLELEYKVLRNMFHYQHNKLLQARLYPQCNDNKCSNELKANIRAIVQKIFADCLGIDNYWKVTKHYGDKITTGNRSRQYHDYYNFTCYMSYPKEMETLENTGDKIVIGEAPMCIECGDEYCIEEDNTINGCSGRPDECGRVVCEDCGRRLDEDDVFCYNGRYYCGDCVTWSNKQNSYIPDSEAVDLIGIHDDVVTKNYAALNENVGYCNCCSSYFYIPDTEGTGYCYNCEKEMESCDECGCLIPEGCEEYHNGNTYCRDCYEDILEQEKEEEYEVQICTECGCIIENDVNSYKGRIVCDDCYDILIESDIEKENKLPLFYKNKSA